MERLLVQFKPTYWMWLMKVGNLVTSRVGDLKWGLGVIVGIDEEGRFEVLWSGKSTNGIYHHHGYEIRVAA